MLQILEDLRRSERLLRASIEEVERMLAEGDSLAAHPPLDTGMNAPSCLHEASVPYESGPARQRQSGDEFHGWKMTEAVLTLLGRFPEGCKNRTVIAALVAGGFRFESSNRDVAVAQCLDRLRRQGKVMRLERGTWMRAGGSQVAP